MPNSSTAATIVLALLLTALGGCGSAPPPDHLDPYISCNGSSSTAIMQLPDPLGRWGRVACTKYGHVIDAATGWQWTGPKSAIVLSSQLADTLQELGNAVYWQSMTVEVIFDDEAATILNRYERDVAPFANSLLVEVWKLRASNNQDVTQTVYFLLDDGKPSAYLCDTGCQTGTPIHITRTTR